MAAKMTWHFLNQGDGWKWNGAVFQKIEDTENEWRTINSIVRCQEMFYDTLKGHEYVSADFQPTPLDNQVYFSRYFRNGKEIASPGQSSGRDLDENRKRKQSQFCINHIAWGKLYDQSFEDAVSLIFHELVHVEETGDYTIGVANTGEKKMDKTQGADVFNEALTNLKTKRLVERLFGAEMPKKEQLDCGLKTNIGLFNYSLATQLVDNMFTAMDVDIDELIKDGINNKANHKETITDLFKNVDVDFINDIATPMEVLFPIIYQNRIRNLTSEEQKIVCDVVKEMQEKTKEIYTRKNPEATTEDKENLSSNFLDYTDIHKHTKFPMRELCGVKPQNGSLIDK